MKWNLKGLALAAILCATSSLFAAATTVTAISPNNGSENGGQFVTITGTGFVAPCVVTFDSAGTSALATNVVVVSTTTIVCTTPAHVNGPAVTVDVDTVVSAMDYTFNAGRNLTLQVVITARVAQNIRIQWAAGTTLDDAVVPVDHTVFPNRISAYNWRVKDAAGLNDLDVGTTYYTTGVGNGKTIIVENVGTAAATITATRTDGPETWAIADAPGADAYALIARMGNLATQTRMPVTGAGVVLVGATAIPASAQLAAGGGTANLEVGFSTPTSSANFADQTATLTLTATP
jgi:hypothetical protein